jgi:hypothetical protein
MTFSLTAPDGAGPARPPWCHPERRQERRASVLPWARATHDARNAWPTPRSSTSPVTLSDEGAKGLGTPLARAP